MFQIVADIDVQKGSLVRGGPGNSDSGIKC
jgi:hypothetical protein